MKYSTYGVELNKKGVNKKIVYNLFDDTTMQEIGFRKVDGDNPSWYFCKVLDKDSVSEITLNVTLPIPCDNDYLDIAVLDEAFCQPYDFQYMLNRKPDFEYAQKVADKFEEYMAYLHDKGVLSGHEIGEYV